MQHFRAGSLHDTRWFQRDVSTRKEEFTKLCGKYAGRLPVMVSYTSQLQSHFVEDPTYKFLVPADLNVGQLLHVVRKKIALQEKEALYLFVDHYNILPATGQTLRQLHSEFQDSQDGFLYVFISMENTYG